MRADIEAVQPSIRQQRVYETARDLLAGAVANDGRLTYRDDVFDVVKLAVELVDEVERQTAQNE